MHIKKLEISGFKSFVDKTVVHFDHDVIGIVGPNGCGKSNIVDSIRWCMGEQSARQLRGKSMEDVIFNGSESRGPAGLAEVTLTFDNSDPVEAASLPPEYAEYAELAVTRRLFRDGTSEYLINKTPVRLRDITDLFLGTGVGTKAYSIVEQGRIGQIVSARAEDRRLFIEEAAGITKYKQRRKQAERKMDQTRQNLLRLNDIVGEIERTRNTLKRQVAKAERFLRYREELEDLELHARSHDLLRLTVVSRVERESLATARAEAAESRGLLAAADEALTAARQEAMTVEERAKDAAGAAFAAENRVTTLVAEIQHASERREQLELRLTTGQSELEILHQRLRALADEVVELDSRIERLACDEQEREADAASEEAALATLRQGEYEANRLVAEVRRRASEASKLAAAAEARIEGLVHRVREGTARQDRLVSERETLEGETATLDAREHALVENVTELAEGRRLTAEERVSLERQLEGHQGELLASERAVDSVKNELGLRRNRLRALEEIHRRLEGVGTGIRALVARQDPTVQGLFADRIEVAPGLTAALAGLLGDQLQYVIVNSPERGLELLEELQRTKRGRAHVVAARPAYVAGRRRREGFPGVGDEAVGGDAGILGHLDEHLHYAPDDEALVRTLIGDAIVTDTPARALAWVARHPGSTAVALDGTVVRPNGVISGGSGDDVAAAMVEQKREMRHLTGEVMDLAAREQQAVAGHNALRARMAEIGTALDRARQGAHEGELAHLQAEKDLARTRSDRDRVRQRCEALATELAELADAIAEAAASEAESRTQLDQLTAELRDFHQEAARAEEAAAEWKERVDAQASLVTERKVRLAQVREQAGSARAARDRVTASISDQQTRSERLDQELLEAAATSGATAARILLARESLGAAQDVEKLARRTLDEANELLEKVRYAIGHREAETRELRAKLSEVDEAVHRHEMELTGLERDFEHLLADVAVRFRGLDLRRVVGDYHLRLPPDAEHRARIKELTQLIERMGPVNLDAQVEFAEAESRFVTLSTQKTDVEKALEELDRAIKHMNRESKRRFRETFDAVNALFKDTFVKLFKGGRAELKLTNPDDLLDTGVDITAQPPGKKLANIELMSGGEKALTAVALIFAIFRHKPSPFCVLDEVDAPLDEANVSRYNEAIRSMTDRSQFILITHIKRTMQMVDVLYGVTMGEPGVSRIVSVKVNDKATTRSDRTATSVPLPTVAASVA
ncbi:MAG: chromosome segregation protein SMC [Polyangiaceae bacterium]|nr:chromosome segregation protein SMC [Polyangiaceae bacterium]